jgi:hypothetical protein
VSGPDPGRKRLIDTMTEAALEVDRAAFADWWGHLKEGTIERQAAEAAWRRAYFVAFVAGAGSELLKRGKR